MQLLLTLLVMMIVVLPLTTIELFASVISALDFKVYFRDKNDVSYADDRRVTARFSPDIASKIQCVPA
jgi:hypothetical protein